MKLGKTLAGSRESSESDFERQKLLKKRERIKRLQLAIFLVMICMSSGVAIVLVQKAIKTIPESTVNKKNTLKYIPSITVIDEDGSNYITDRMKQYIGMLEKDLSDHGKKAVKAIIPTGKAREIDVYIEGRDEYYKCNLDRGTAESAEDLVRMVEYLKKHAIKPVYVDIRIEGRAYYK